MTYLCTKCEAAFCTSSRKRLRLAGWTCFNVDGALYWLCNKCSALR